ncbi:MAG: hypothetical protein DRN53_06725 [Thermoprotei archaeon]|nr:MAG: hypothetical protein DRN53_06725 [Thermoprotei archaeon]
MIAAVADVHSPKYIDLFRQAIRSTPWDSVEVLLFIGDMVNRGKIDEYKRVLDALEGYYEGDIIGILGNEEYEQYENEIVSRFDRIVWLRDEGIELTLDDYKVGIVGTRGILDRPTFWQRKNIPDIVSRYHSRLRRIEDVLRNFRKRVQVLILLSHYSVTFKTLEGERRSIWREMGSTRMESLIVRYGVDLAIHGHAHRSRVLRTRLSSGALVVNASLPAVKSISLVDLRKEVVRRGILGFI